MKTGMTEPSCAETAFRRVLAVIRLLLDVEKRIALRGHESGAATETGGATSVEAAVHERVSAASRANARARSITA
jgi:hypothetical protein